MFKASRIWAIVFAALCVGVIAVHEAPPVGAQVNTPGVRQNGAVALNQCASWVTDLTIKSTGAPCFSATPSAFSKTDDTNVTATLTGTPGTALLQSMNFALGWTGTLAAGRLNSNVVQAITNDTNITGAIAAQNLTLGWTGTLAAARLNANVVQSIVNDTNIQGAISAQALTFSWAGTLANNRLANMANGTIKCRTTAGTGSPEDCTGAQATALLSAMIGDSGAGGTKGLVPAPGVGDATKVLSGAGTFVSAGTGTVTSAQVAAGTGISVSGTCTITTTGVCTVATNLSQVTNFLGSDVALNNTANYFDGPSTAQGTSGTWLASGTVTLADSAGAALIYCKLWDGTTIISSGAYNTSGAGIHVVFTLSGVLATPAANIKISCRDLSSINGVMSFNTTGNSKDAGLTVVRLN